MGRPVSEPWIAVLMSIGVVVMYATVWGYDFADWVHYRDKRSLVKSLASGLILTATVAFLGIAFQRAGVLNTEARIWLVYIVRGALLMGGILLLVVRFGGGRDEQ